MSVRKRAARSLFERYAKPFCKIEKMKTRGSLWGGLAALHTTEAPALRSDGKIARRILTAKRGKKNVICWGGAAEKWSEFSSGGSAKKSQHSTGFEKKMISRAH